MENIDEIEETNVEDTNQTDVYEDDNIEENNDVEDTKEKPVPIENKESKQEEHNESIPKEKESLTEKEMSKKQSIDDHEKEYGQEHTEEKIESKVISDFSDKRSADDIEILKNISSYVKVNTFDDGEMGFPFDLDFVRTNTIELKEDILGQELLNELYKGSLPNDTGFEAKLEIPSDQKIKSSEHSENSFESLATRLDLLTRLKETAHDRKVLLNNNHMYQSKLVEYFKLVKAKQKAGHKSVGERDLLIDFNTQYERYQEILQILMIELENDMSKYNEKIEKQRQFSEVKTKQNNYLNKDLKKYQENIGLSALHSRTGFKIDPEDIRYLFATEAKKEAIIKDERLKNLKLEHKNLRFDRALRSKENFEGGLRLIDFEQLKIENQTFSEKVEERREAINKLNRKIKNCNHLLSHIKEKINFTDNDKKISNTKLSSLQTSFKKLQKLSNRSKKMRDIIKANNKTLEMSCGLLGNKDSLRHYEECNDRVAQIRNSIMRMQWTIKNNSLKTDDLVKKINYGKK